MEGALMPATLGNAYVQILPSAQGISQNITKELNGGGGVSKAGESAGNSFGKSLIKTVAALGIGKVAMDGVKAAFSEGAALQQSLGGVETLFKENADTVIKNAQNAYKTAGLSANEYMESVTSFSASLLQSLGGDTEKAASVADMALTDMSDNANKFGTDMGSIQTAYQGFAKQNYTMLDNLKLGYGGTKSEMERLLKDASKLSGVKYDISNLNDVYSAIHVIQDNLGVTGTTAKEASSTFSGAFASMSAAAKNFFGALTTGGDVAGTLSSLIDSAVVFVQGNVIPMLGEMLSSLPGALQTVLAQYGPAAGEALIGMFQKAVAMLPEVFSGMAERINGLFDAMDTSGIVGKGVELVGTLVTGLISAIPSLVSALGSIVGRAVEFFGSNLPQFLQKGREVLGAIVGGIGEALPKIGETVLELISSLVTSIGEHFPEILELGISLLGELQAGILNGIANLPQTVMKVTTAIVNKFEETDWIAIGKDIIEAIKNGIQNYISTLTPAVKNVVKTIDTQLNFTATLAKVRGVFNNIRDAIRNAIANARDIVRSAVDRIKGAFNFSWSLPHLNLPHISVTGGVAPFGIGGKGSLPKFNIQWYAKAENNPFMFDGATLFGAGERNDEILYGKDALMRDIRTAVGTGGTVVNNYITVNGAEDPEAWASKFARQMKIQMRMA